MNNPSSTWNLLNDEQRRAILAFTREDSVLNALIAAERRLPGSGTVEAHDIALELLDEIEAMTNQIDALRLAFGLGEDGVTPAIEESEQSSDRENAIAAVERAEKAIKELVGVGERATQQRDAAEQALDEARAEIERLKKDLGEAVELIERPCGEDGGSHDWQDGSCPKCCMDYDRRFIDQLAYDETYQRVQCALDNSSYGNGMDAVRGAVDAVIAWRDNLASGHPPSTFSIRPIRERAEK